MTPRTATLTLTVVALLCALTVAAVCLHVLGCNDSPPTAGPPRPGPAHYWHRPRPDGKVEVFRPRPGQQRPEWHVPRE